MDQGAHGTLARDRPPRLGCADISHWFDGLWRQKSRALCLQVGEVRRTLCTSPMDVLPSGARADTSSASGPSYTTMPRPEATPTALTSVGARICLGDWESGVSATSTGGGVPCGGSKSASSSGPGIAGAPALMAGECCILAASKVVGGGDGNKVSDLAFSCVARWPTPGSCSSTRRSPFRQTRRPSPPTFKSCKTTFDPSPPISLAPRV